VIKSKVTPKQARETGEKVALGAIKWQAVTLRFTAFFPLGSEPSSDLWFSFTETQPEQATDQFVHLTREEIGTLNDMTFVVRRSPGRVDALLTIGKIPAEGGTGIPYIGDFEDALLKFVPLADHWFKQKTNVIRLAFGAVLYAPAETMTKANELIKVLVPSLRISGESYSDLLFQINRPRPSQTLSDVRLNRLAKWQALPASIVVGPFQSAQLTSPPVVQLELDINSPPDRTQPIPAEVAPRLFLEMVEAAQEIAKRGDSE
jgi:hypothetical protein